jgi:prepilin-type N-terminal cleavage/methylation domain-containing protein
MASPTGKIGKTVVGGGQQVVKTAKTGVDGGWPAVRRRGRAGLPEQPIGLAVVQSSEAVCGRQSVNIAVIIINPPAAAFTPLIGKLTGMKTKNKMTGAGFTLVEIMIVVAIIGLLAAIAIPNFVSARGRAQANACINNLRQIDAAANQFALEQGRTTGSAINFPGDLTPYIKLNASSSLPPCPAGGTYSDDKVGGLPHCSLGSNVSPPHVLP